MTFPVKWLIEKNVFFDGNPERMAELARDLGMECRIIEYTDGQEVRAFPPGQHVVAYGSMGFIRDMVRAGMWRPTAWFDAETLSCHHYYQYWERYILQQGCRFMSLGEISRLRAELYRELGVDDRLFIRPDDNLKSFAGTVVPLSEFDPWYQQNVRCYDLDPSLPCLIARPRQILKEWRVVIAERQVLTASPYIGESRSAALDTVPQAVLALAGQIAGNSEFNPLPVYVMDIAQTPEGLRLLEIGSMNCASLYACDLRKIIETATHLAIAV